MGGGRSRGWIFLFGFFFSHWCFAKSVELLEPLRDFIDARIILSLGEVGVRVRLLKNCS